MRAECRGSIVIKVEVGSVEVGPATVSLVGELGDEP